MYVSTRGEIFNRVWHLAVSITEGSFDDFVAQTVKLNELARDHPIQFASVCQVLRWLSDLPSGLAITRDKSED